MTHPLVDPSVRKSAVAFWASDPFTSYSLRENARSAHGVFGSSRST